MKLILALFTCLYVFDKSSVLGHLIRNKREASGTLDILTNHAQPIHADVKSDRRNIVEKVTPPKDVVYDVKSLRKSLPLTNKLDLVRAISRIVTLTAIIASAVIEFYPIVKHLCYSIHDMLFNYS